MIPIEVQGKAAVGVITSARGNVQRSDVYKIWYIAFHIRPRQDQCAVIQFLHTEGCKPAEIHRLMQFATMLVCQEL
jgi:hypothetical protein